MATPTSAIQKIVSNKNKFENQNSRVSEQLVKFNPSFADKKNKRNRKCSSIATYAIKKTEMHIRSLKTLESRASKVFQGVLFARKQKLLQMEAVIEKLQKK